MSGINLGPVTVVSQLTGEPSNPVGGQLYYHTTNGNLYVYDAVVEGWVDLTAAGGAQLDQPNTWTATQTFRSGIGPSDPKILIQDSADTTKLATFDVSGVATGTTRTLTVPDASGTIATQEYISSLNYMSGFDAANAFGETGGANTWTGEQTFDSTKLKLKDELGTAYVLTVTSSGGGTLNLGGFALAYNYQLGAARTWTALQTYRDTAFELTDQTTTSKKMVFELSGISASTTRTLTVPDASGTIALTSDLSTSAYQTTIGNGSNTSFTVTHSLNSTAVVVSVTEVASPFRVVDATVAVTGVNTVTVDFLVAPATNEYRVVVIKAGATASTTSRTFNTGHTWTIGGTVAAQTTPVMFVPVADTQSVSLVAARHKIASGTSVTVQVRRNGTNVGSTITVGPTSTTTALGPVTLSNGDELDAVITSPTGTPIDLSFSLTLEHVI